jgi:ketosteroid isomerase-like protein
VCRVILRWAARRPPQEQGAPTLAEHPSVARFRQAYAALAAGDLPAVLEQFAPDIIFHVGGDGPLAGPQKGREAAAAALVHGFEVSGGTQRFDVRSIFADDDHAVVHVRETATRAADGATLDVEEVHLFAIDPDGLIAEIWDIPADPQVHDDFFDGR